MHRTHLAARRRLGVALDDLSDVFRGMTAHPDEHNCPCHWGSAEEVSLLKTPDVELEPDLLRRTWQAVDWDDHAAVLRRILPQFATALVAGHVRQRYELEEAGYSFARGRWQQWPDEQADAVREFLHAWWVRSLTDPDAPVPAHEVLVLCAEASGTLGPWLADWEAHTGSLSDRRLAEAVAEWEPNWSAGCSATPRPDSARRTHRRTCGTGYVCSPSPTRPAGRTPTGPTTATDTHPCARQRPQSARPRPRSGALMSPVRGVPSASP
ncbi:hypothetical protein ACWGH3_05255 [Streptomyces sp. NPDC054884]